MVARGRCHPPTAFYDCQIKRRIKYHCTYCLFPRPLPIFLCSALVSINLFRINNWNMIVLPSFTAGIVQTALYADFIYYFIKSNQNERIIRLPIWFVIFLITILTLTPSITCTPPPLLSPQTQLTLVLPLQWVSTSHTLLVLPVL